MERESTHRTNSIEIEIEIEIEILRREKDIPIQPPLITSRTSTSLLRQTRIKQPPKLVIDRPGC